MANANVDAGSDKELDKQKRRAREAAAETRSAAFRAGAVWIPVGPILCVILLAVLKEALLSAQELATEQAGFPTEPLMPLALFAALGACYGAFVAWRVTSSSGAVGGPVLMLVAVCMLSTFAAGAIGSMFIFDNGIPMFAWLSASITAIVGLGTAWLTNFTMSSAA